MVIRIKNKKTLAGLRPAKVIEFFIGEIINKFSNGAQSFDKSSP